ncbi:MAG TPA: tetratricopeptide repeat protein [Candidatus Polarisedimenticolia bacterium]
MSRTQEKSRRMEAAGKVRATAGGAIAWRDMGRDALFSGDPAEALWFLRHAVEIDPDDPLSWQVLGRCFEQIGEQERARKCYRLATRRHLLSGTPDEQRSSGMLSLARKPREPKDV